MSATNINRVVLTGRITRDPEHSANRCRLRLAVNGRVKDPGTGAYVDRPHYFDVIAWDALAATCVQYLRRGRAVAIDGRLSWSEYESSDGTGTRQRVEIVADRVQFLDSTSHQHPANGPAEGQA